MAALFRALLVDDEELPRLRLRQLLRAHPEVAVVGEAESVTDAEAKARELNPDVIFLDVQMPRNDGFALMPRLDTLAHIVFVTSHDRFALRGFEVNALDYLLKPVQAARLSLTVQRLKAASKNGDEKSGAPSVDDMIVVGDASHSRVTAVGGISCLAADGNYSRLRFADGSPDVLMLRNLADWESFLPSPPFVRADRSLIVNLSCVRKFSAGSRDEAELHLEGREAPLTLGRAASTRLRAALREFDSSHA